jgi:hypothetical protein
MVNINLDPNALRLGDGELTEVLPPQPAGGRSRDLGVRLRRHGSRPRLGPRALSSPRKGRRESPGENSGRRVDIALWSHPALLAGHSTDR